MKRLTLFYSVVLVAMLSGIIWASLSQNLFTLPPQVALHPWFIVTLMDTYFAFATIYLWMAYKTETLVGRIVWFLMVIALGNVAIALFMLKELRKYSRHQNLTWFIMRKST
jgi:hypothetical protein